MKLSIIIPCYNEEEGIKNLTSQLDPVLHELKGAYELEVLFIDDGSTDKTNELLERHYSGKKGIRIIRHKKNMNLGGALKTGFMEATGDYIVTMDSDCTYPPGEILPMLKLLDDSTDMVSASPYHPQGNVVGVPKYRLFLSRTISGIYNLMLRKNIYTYTALFRVYKKKVIKNIKIKSNNFLGVTEAMVFSLLKGCKVKEYPTTLYVRKYGSSKIRLFDIIFSHLGFILFLLKLKLMRKI